MRGAMWTAMLGAALFLSGSATGQTEDDGIARAEKGWSMDQGHDPAWYLAQHRKLDSALGGLLPQRPGVVDAYVVSVGLDADPVFGREAREAANVLSRRYGASGRTVVLTTGHDEKAPQGSPTSRWPLLRSRRR
jgi:hypothetical protein